MFIVARQFQAIGVNPRCPWERASRRRVEQSRRGFGRSRSRWLTPITVISSLTEAFVQRVRKRLQAHDAARQQFVQELIYERAKIGCRDWRHQFKPHKRSSQTWSRMDEECRGETPGETAGFTITHVMLSRPCQR